MSQTLRNADDLDSARSTTMNRIKALATAHDLLISGHKDAGTVGAMIEASLAPHDDGSRLDIGGPVIPIGSEAALTLSLVIHELATNASKYGALSAPEGRVEIRWSVIEEREAGKALLAFSWTEHNGPPVSPPRHQGSVPS